VIDEYFTVLDTRLKLGQGLADKTYDTLRLDPDGNLLRENYVVLFSPTLDEGEVERYMKEPDADDAIPFEVEVRVVGTAVPNVRKMLSVAVGQFRGFRVGIEGRSPVMLRCVGVTQVRPDTAVKPFLYWASTSFAWTSRKG